MYGKVCTLQIKVVRFISAVRDATLNGVLNLRTFSKAVL